MAQKVYTRRELEDLGFTEEEISRALARNNVSGMRKAVGYIRVSTDKQAEDSKYGTKVQRDEIEEYAKRHNYNIIEWYEEVCSGAADERPVFDSIVFGRTGLVFDAVISYKSDRIARDTKRYFYYLFCLEKQNIKLLSCKEDFEEGNELANIYRSIVQFCAEQERRNILMRTNGGRERKYISGGWAGGRPPYGYTIRRGLLEIIEEDANVVRTIFRWRRQNGWSVNRIAIELNKLGKMTTEGCMWQPMTVQRVIKNERVYEGYVNLGGRGWRKGVHTPLIKEGIYVKRTKDGAATDTEN